MQSVDIFMHVRPLLEDGGQNRGLAVFFNPTSEVISDSYSLPLYYTGLTKEATLILEGDMSKLKKAILNRDFCVDISIGTLSNG